MTIQSATLISRYLVVSIYQERCGGLVMCMIVAAKSDCQRPMTSKDHLLVVRDTSLGEFAVRQSSDQGEAAAVEYGRMSSIQ